ncbi:MAG: nucleotidyltransferase [Holosporales bacterium]|jgi:hypothetical protein|nr:nucleotidyltransferase [Holosporales bacterium]
MGKIDDLLKANINITQEMEEQARGIYKEVSDFLHNELCDYNPDIFPQGSFNLGTIIKPIKGDEFDLDFVCVLKNIYETTPSALKKTVGDVLKKKYKGERLSEKNRCWQLHFQSFHVDVLPAVPATKFDLYSELSDNWKKAPLLIPDKELKDWKDTNPLGYAEWFRERVYQNAH